MSPGFWLTLATINAACAIVLMVLGQGAGFSVVMFVYCGLMSMYAAR